MRLDLLTKKFTKQLNLYHFLFPYTSENSYHPTHQKI